jgi:hypothetical protein
MSYIIPNDRWCNIVVLNVYALSEDKCDDTKDSFYEELDCVFNQFRKYDMKILLGYFIAKVGREDTLKPVVGNKSLHETSNNNDEVVNIATLKIYSCQEYKVPTSQNS